jgi:hypothetical protein
VNGDLNLQKIPKLVSIPKKRSSRKNVDMVKDEDEESEKTIVKTRVTNILCLHSSILCSKSRK